MHILALDLGTKTGVAYGDAGAPPARVCIETWELPAAGGADVGAFMHAFAAKLRDRLMRGVTLLAFEAPFVGPKMLGNMHTCRRLIGLPAICEMLAYGFNIEAGECSIPTVKKEFAGHGRAEKPQMIAAARRRGFQVSNDHEADAAACFVHAVTHRKPGLAHIYDPIFARPNDGGVRE